MTANTELPAFPLGTVLLPHQVLTLQVFEPRYRVMLFDLREHEHPRFLVTLITRGSEVGGGDVRSEVGCLAEVSRSVDQPDGRVLIEVVGLQPMRVLEWLPEDPYPLATAEPLEPPDGALRARVDPEALERILELDGEMAELLEHLGIERPDLPVEPVEPARLVWQVALANPLGPLDRQHLLAEPDLAARVEALATMLEDQRELLRARLEWR